jgi:hypothetical protein
MFSLFGTEGVQYFRLPKIFLKKLFYIIFLLSSTMHMHVELVGRCVNYQHDTSPQKLLSVEGVAKCRCSLILGDGYSDVWLMRYVIVPWLVHMHVHGQLLCCHKPCTMKVGISSSLRARRVVLVEDWLVHFRAFGRLYASCTYGPAQEQSRRCRSIGHSLLLTRISNK